MRPCGWKDPSTVCARSEQAALSVVRSMSSVASLPIDPGALIRSRQYRVLLVLAAIIGLIVSSASWGFLELVHELQILVYTNLPHGLGYASAPVWWSIPWLALAGLLTAAAVAPPGTRRTCSRRGAQGRRDADPTHRASWNPSRRLGHTRSRARAGPGGAADRVGDGSCDPVCAPDQNGRAGAGAVIDGRCRKLRCGRVDLRFRNSGDRAGETLAGRCCSRSRQRSSRS